MITVNNKDSIKKNQIRFVCISDTHGKTNIEIPNGDVLSKITPQNPFKFERVTESIIVHAGDLTVCGSMTQFNNTIEWLSTLPHKIKIITAGNHDHYLDPTFGYNKQRNQMLAFMKKHNIVYLEHQKYQLPAQLGGFILFVSPYAPLHYQGAFMLEDLSTIWDDIEGDIDILVTHTPPQGYLDTIRYKNLSVGCGHLRSKIDNVIHPQVHVFGHIHESYGYLHNEETGQLFINASICDHGYRPNRKPITFDLPKHTQKINIRIDE